MQNFNRRTRTKASLSRSKQSREGWVFRRMRWPIRHGSSAFANITVAGRQYRLTVRHCVRSARGVSQLGHDTSQRCVMEHGICARATRAPFIRAARMPCAIQERLDDGAVAEARAEPTVTREASFVNRLWEKLTSRISWMQPRRVNSIKLNSIDCAKG